MRASQILGLHRPFATPDVALPGEALLPLQLPALMEYAEDCLMTLTTLNLRRYEERLATWWDGQKAPSVADSVAQNVDFVHGVCSALPAELPRNFNLGETLVRGMRSAAYYLEMHPMTLDLRLATAKAFAWAGVGAALQDQLPLAGHFLGQACANPLMNQWLQKQLASPNENLIQHAQVRDVLQGTYRQAI